MAWIESHQTLRHHPKLAALAAALAITKVEATGHLHFLWWWCLDYAQDGNLGKHNDAVIEDAADWRGDSGRFVECLRQSGFLEEGQLHDWDDYAGRLIRSRSRHAERMRAARAPHVKVTLGATVPNPTVPNRTSTPQSPLPGVEGVVHREDPQERNFLAFWSVYPKRVGKGAARRVWTRLRPNSERLEAILKAVEAHKSSDQWLKEGGRFIPNPATWLSQERWSDDLTSSAGDIVTQILSKPLERGF